MEILDPPNDNKAYKLVNIDNNPAWVQLIGERNMLENYSRKKYSDDWDNGIHNEITVKAKSSSGRDWRRTICRHLIDDLLVRISGHEEDDSMMQLLPIITLLDHGMCYTARKMLEKVERLQDWDVTKWLIKSMLEIESDSDYFPQGNSEE